MTRTEGADGTSWLERLTAAVKGRLQGQYAFDVLRHCVNEENYPDQRGIKLDRGTTDFLSMMGNTADEILEVVAASARLEASEGGWGPDERYAQLKEANAALRRKLEGE